MIQETFGICLEHLKNNLCKFSRSTIIVWHNMCHGRNLSDILKKVKLKNDDMKLNICEKKFANCSNDNDKLSLLKFYLQLV